MLKDYINFQTAPEDYGALYFDTHQGIPSVVFGLPFSAKCNLVYQMDLPVLYIAQDVLLCEKIKQELTHLTNENVVVLYPKDDVLLYKKSFSKYALFKRLNALHQITKKPKFIVSTLEALLQLFPTEIKCLTFEKNCDYSLDNVVKTLVDYGYKRVDSLENEGTFSLRGDILDIFAINCENPYRLDFFGDSLESIKIFDKESRKTISQEKAVEVIMATDVNICPQEVLPLCKKLRTFLKESKSEGELNAQSTIEQLEVQLQTNKNDSSNSFLLPLIKNSTSDIFKYIQKDSLVVFDESKFLKERIDSIEKEHAERLKNLIDNGLAFSFTKGQLSCKEQLVNQLLTCKNLAVQTLTTAVEFFSPLKTFNFKCGKVPKYQLKFNEFVGDCKNWLTSEYEIIVCYNNKSKAEQLATTLQESKIPCVIDGKKGFCGVNLVNCLLSEGFILHDAKVVVVGCYDLYNKKSSSNKIQKRAGEFFSAPEVGDIAVHETHGIGRVVGTKKITSTEGTKDYVAIEYRDGDVLYISTEQMDTLSRYLGSEQNVPLSKIGGVEFERAKKRAIESIKKMSFDLKKLYEERQMTVGYPFEEDEQMQHLFEDAFVFEETADQLVASEEIKQDMMSSKVMDRLLCGDVGFGKTEVAFRAIFRCVCNIKQAILLAPTTILTQQHYNSALERFKGFGIKIEVLNRFKTKAQQEKILHLLKNGEIDLIIGTHRLLSKDVHFKDLGLLVLDEEQRFGVEHKEKLKLFKKNVDTLTMTATPIPRTLNMSLTNIRDISTLNTPPRERIPIDTYVTEENDQLICDAIIRELARGGQAFILYNRVESIDHFAGKLQALLKDVKFVVAHGQMEEKVLERKIYSFYKGEQDVLISTTIIENGIDLPRANTMIVIDADRLGLSTLYQLKGRVGRSNRLGHAYFTFKRNKVLTSESQKRLTAIMEFTEMGSGFKIALRDLEIRGAGNVLGKEQHGQMDKIGYELYSKLLKEEIYPEKKNWAIELDVRVSAFIPDDYIKSSSLKMDVYKAIAEMKNSVDYNRIKNSLLDIYGEIPLETNNLLKIAIVKLLATKLKATKVIVANKQCSIFFESMESFENTRILSTVEQMKSVCKLVFSQKPEISFSVKGRTNTEMLTIIGLFLKKCHKK